MWVFLWDAGVYATSQGSHEITYWLKGHEWAWCLQCFTSHWYLFYVRILNLCVAIISNRNIWNCSMRTSTHYGTSTQYGVWCSRPQFGILWAGWELHGWGHHDWGHQDTETAPLWQVPSGDKFLTALDFRVRFWLTCLCATCTCFKYMEVTLLRLPGKVFQGTWRGRSNSWSSDQESVCPIHQSVL